MRSLRCSSSNSSSSTSKRYPCETDIVSRGEAQQQCHHLTYRNPQTHFVHIILATSIRPSGSSCNAPHRAPPEFISVRRLVKSLSSAFTFFTRSVACVSPHREQQKHYIKR